MMTSISMTGLAAIPGMEVPSNVLDRDSYIAHGRHYDLLEADLWRVIGAPARSRAIRRSATERTLRTVEMAAAAQRGHSQRAQESTSHGVGAREAAGQGDLVQSFSCSLQHPPRSFNTHLQNVTGW
jgi:hypothetical protein